MATWNRAVHFSVCLAALVALAHPGVAAPGQPGELTAPAPSVSPVLTVGTGAAAAPSVPSTTSRREIEYAGVSVEVPAGWPVVDLRTDPHACVRLDHPAVFLGELPAQQDCPAHLVGRADTIWLHGPTRFDRPAPAVRKGTIGTLPAEVASDPVGHGRQVHFTGRPVQADVSWGTDSRTVDAVLATAAVATGQSVPRASGPPPATPPVSPSASAGSGRPAVDLSSAVSTAATTTPSSTFTGMAFDTCAAPTGATMKSWLASPYRTVGIYIGGSMRACADGNLSSSWVSAVSSMGWGLAPIYVGAQAPCVNQSGLSTFSSSTAAAEGKSSADDAVSRAAYFGLAAGAPIYYDMEAYNTTVAGCSSAVMAFISAWSKELHALGYTAGAYGSTDSLMTDMSRYVGTSGFVPPKDIWFADWNGLQTTSDTSFSSAYWTNHERLHQYSGGVSQTWGGVTINIDADWSDADVAGVGVPVDYGTDVLGPGSAGFVFTGNMSYWRPNPPQGLKGMAYWTYSNGATEYNGATWSPRLAPGLYKVQAYIPATAATATAPYTVTYAGGSSVQVVNQQAISGYTTLGTYLASSTRPISVHVGDNDGTSTTSQLGIDAMAFQLVATAPGASVGVTATAGDATATVSWGAAPSNGSPITSYTVQAVPGGASVTVPGTATSAAFSGLTNGTAYTFTVTATNAVGPGPGATSNTVTPHSPVTLPHDWNSDTHNDVLARDTSGNLWLYPGDGSGGWLAPRQVGTGWSGMTMVAPGDFNGDGHLDLLARDGSGVLWLYPGDGSGGWLGPRQVGTGWSGMTMVAPGDFDGDGHPDVLARDASGNLWLYPGDGSGGWLARRQVGTGWSGMTMVAPGDFDGDGHPDVLARDASGNLWLYPGDGSGSWLGPRQVGTGWSGMTALV
ncbi:glycoside hydrolase domain-containing protein [Pedococcus sp. NPDC057267]|uniref:glycoside hydrolase domain-containing protein n=1 Tax=Pedococcus sp. NPDC057267 TaxID=3346077 RepID=UPI0036432C04